MTELSASADSATSRRRGTKRRTALLLVGAVLGVVFLWLAVRGVDLARVGHELRRADASLVVAAGLLLVVPFALLGLRWRHIAASTINASPATFVELTFVGGAVNNCLPGRLGEVAKALGLSRTTGRPAMVALGTIITDRMADVVFFAGCFAVSAAPFLDHVWARYVAAGGAVMVVAAGVVLVVAIGAVRRNPGSNPHGRLRRQLWFLAAGLASVRGLGVWVRVAGITLLAWGMWMAGMYLAARSVGVALSAPQVAFATSVLGLGTAIPSLPGFVGTYHWLATTCLVAFGVAHDDAFAVAVLLHALWFVPMTVVGLPLLFRAGLRVGMLGTVHGVGEGGHSVG